jgi:ABC-2 type transport system permease protein
MIDIGLFRSVLLSEWTKLRSVRSTYWTIVAAIVLGIGLSAAICAAQGHAYSGDSFHDRAVFDPTSFSLAGLFFAQLALGVMAIMVMSAEYSTGMIRATLAAVPQRGYVLAAKAVVVAVTGFVVGTSIAFASFFLGQLIFSHYSLNVTLGDPGVLRAVIGGGLYITALMLMALGLAALIRHTAGAITLVVGIAFIVPIFAQLLPHTWQQDLVRYLPAEAGSSILNVIPSSDSLGPWAGFGFFLIWVAAFIAGGWYLLRTRDV